MFLHPAISEEASARKNKAAQLPAPVGGLNALVSVMEMPSTDAAVLENFVPYPDRLELRPGYLPHKTGSLENVDRLHPYSSPTGVDSLWATTDDGVFNVTSAGVWPASSAGITNGKTIGSILSTGASNYLTLVNGTDAAVQYDGAALTQIAAFGTLATTDISYIETYRQRYYLIKKNSMEMFYLDANAKSGTSTPYLLSALFRRGGYLVALGTWTIDGGTGSDDHLVAVTSQGEVGVFTGTDPGSIETWAFKGVFYIGRPLGPKPLFKYGGDLLYLGENGLFPLSKALLVASLDRTQSVSRKIAQVFSNAGLAYFSNEGWEINSLPDIPLVLVNVPGDPVRYQYVMHAQTGSWSIYTGWPARCFARLGALLYYGTNDGVYRVTGNSDDGANIVGSFLQAYSKLGFSRAKKIQQIRPMFQANGTFAYTMGISRDFRAVSDMNTIPGSISGAASLWGTGIWGTSIWQGMDEITREWRSVTDDYSTWKAFYLQVSTNASKVKYLGADFLATEGGSF